MKYKNKKGFTLAELLIVVAIIAVLVAISIPVFSGQLEKARKAVDMQQARNISSVLTNAFNMGEIQIPLKNNDTNKESALGAWVMICRDRSSMPEAYAKNVNKVHNSTVFCGSDADVIVNGVKSSLWSTYDDQIENILKNSGIDLDSLKIHSKDQNSKSGWDWIIIEIGCLKSDNKFFSRIYSGMKNEKSSLGVNLNSNIEKLISSS